MDVCKYDCMDAEGRATQDAKAENNAGAVIEDAKAEITSLIKLVLPNS